MERSVPLSPLILRWVHRWILWLNGHQGDVRVVDRASVRRILVVRLDRIGDVVMMASFLRELRRGFPAARITLVVGMVAFNLVGKCPYLDEVVVFRDPPASPWRQALRLMRAIWLGFRRIRGESFDLALVPRWDASPFVGPLLALISKARWRVAYSEQVNAEKARFNRGYDGFFTHTLDRRGGRHEVQSNLDLLQCLGIGPVEDRLELWWTPGDEARVDELLREGGVRQGERLLALAPGAAEANKVWPWSRFVEMGRTVCREYGFRLVLVGGAAERGLVRAAEGEFGAGMISAVDRLTLRQTAALLRRCALFVGNDSGPMHMAAAVQVPVVMISRCVKGGDPSRDQAPERFAPWGTCHQVVQPGQALLPCHDRCLAATPHCILGVEVPEVLAAVRNLLGAASATPPGGNE